MRTEILAITDRSGSMSTLQMEVIGGFNRFIKEQKEVPGEARVTFAQFDDVYEVVYEGKPIADVPELTKATYQPRGYTALYDAIGRTLNDQGARIAREGWAELVIVNIITDGMENASREYTVERVKEMTAHAEAHGWKFIFQAANQDATFAAKAVGINHGISNTFGANIVGASAAYGAASASTASLRSGGSGATSAVWEEKLRASVVQQNRP